MNINTKKYVENYVKIRNKEGKMVNLILNEPQMKLYNIIKKCKEEKKPVRIIILKARQMGFSTATESFLFKDTVTKFNRRTGIITHLDTATTNLFNMSKLMYERLPEELKPSVKASNAKELIFDNDTGTGLKSKIKCMTAGTSGVGRSDTFDNLHLSELAFWQGDVKETLTGLFQAVPNLPDTMIIIESTANGYEMFKELWDKAVKGENDFYPLFVAWYEMSEYKMPYSGFKLTPEEEKMKDRYNLSNDQLEWRRWCIRNNCSGDVEQFKQEYPSNPEEAFLSTGNCIFDKEQISLRLTQIPKPIKRGYFTYNEEQAIKGKMTDIKWVNDPRGCIKIYETPDRFTKYCIGGDTAGDTKGDNFTADVINSKTLKQVATLEMQTDEDLYAKQMYCLGYYYKYQYRTGKIEPALMSIEVNFSTFPQKELERLGYDNFYVREVVDRYDKELDHRFGFRTTRQTKPIILSNLVQIVRENVDYINDENTLREMLTMVRKDDGKQEAEEGFHDDHVMSCAIAYYSISQIVQDNDIIEMQYKYNFEVEKPRVADYGEEIQII